MKRFVSVLVLLLPVIADAQLPLKDQLPPWAAERLTSVATQLQLELSGRINPFLQRGDFDGDGKADIALLVQQKENHKIGVLILQRNGKQTLLGAGRTFDNGGDDFEWLDQWWIEDRTTTKRNQDYATVKLQGDGLMLAKSESASALVYFKAGEFKWQQKGD